MTHPSPPSADSHRLVVVGGGVAGLDIATHLAGKRTGDTPLSVMLIDREPAYVWKPMLHTIAAGTSDAGAQQTIYAAQARHHGFAFQPGEAIGIDRDAREVRLAPLRIGDEDILPARAIPYDTLVLAVGSRADDFGTAGVAEHCATIDSRTDAMRFNDRLRVRLLKAVAAGTSLTVAIVGGGATGVELAAELIRTATIAEDHGATAASGRLKVVLIEAGPRILGPFPERLAEAARDKLAELGVTVRTDARVASVDEAGFHLEGGETIAAELTVWAAGVKAPPLIGTLAGLDQARLGRLAVGPTLATAADPRIYAVGDCANPALPGRDDPVPTTAQAAHQQAVYLCRHLPDLIAGKAAPPADYHDFGALVSLGGYDAFGSLGRFGFFDGGFIRGRIAQLGHAMLYRSFQARLHGLRKGSLLWLADTIGRRTGQRPGPV